MPKIVKSISLDEQTAPLANEKSNFSAWVREQLLTEIQYTIPCVYFNIYHTDRKGNRIFEKIISPDGSVTRKPVKTKEICNGAKKPSCKKCYPEGPPKREDWLLYASNQIDKKELLSRASDHWKWRTDQIEEKQASKNQEKVPSMGGVKPKRAYVRRALTWIWSYIW